MDSTAFFFSVFSWNEDFKICGIILESPPLGAVKGEIWVYHSGYDKVPSLLKCYAIPLGTRRRYNPSNLLKLKIHCHNVTYQKAWIYSITAIRTSDTWFINNVQKVQFEKFPTTGLLTACYVMSCNVMLCLTFPISKSLYGSDSCSWRLRLSSIRRWANRYEKPGFSR
jgi:hypothetical protein